MYVVDPRTETCVLVSAYEPRFSVAVSCAKLKGNVPEAAPLITW